MEKLPVFKNEPTRVGSSSSGFPSPLKNSEHQSIKENELLPALGVQNANSH